MSMNLSLNLNLFTCNLLSVNANEGNKLLNDSITNDNSLVASGFKSRLLQKQVYSNSVQI